MTVRKLTPNRGLDNKMVEELLRVIASHYIPPGRRWRGWKPAPPERASWEIVLGHKAADFYLVMPQTWAQVMEKQISVVWPRVKVETVADPLTDITPTAVGQVSFKNHYMFGLKTSRSVNILPGLLELTRMLQEGEEVVVQFLLTPAPPDWWQKAAEAYENFRKGNMPGRVKLDVQTITQYALTGVALMAMEFVNVTTELVTGSASDVKMDGPSKAEALRERPIGSTVANKLRQDALDVTIRIGVTTRTPQAAKSVLRAAGFAFRVLDGDNALELDDDVSQGEWAKVAARESGWLKLLNHDYMTLEELVPLMQLPNGDLQEEFGIESVAHTETPNLPAVIRGNGLRLGWAQWKGEKFPVVQPLDNIDVTCLPRVVIGPMGCGKTRGYGANLAVEAVQKGYYAIILDPANGEMGDEVEAYLGKDKVQRLRFGGDMKVGLDWREVRHASDERKGRNRLAQQLIAFVDAATDEAGAQTVRYLRSAAKVVPGGRLAEVIRLFTDSAYVQSLLSTMGPRDQPTWRNWVGLSDARRAQIASPVLNRLDVIMGDDYLADCMEADEGLDFVAMLDDGNPRCIVLDIPKGDLGPDGLDIIAALMATKLDLAMVTRQSQTPVFIIQDEPHQYLRSSKTWKSVAVESRKWRFAYVWMFHSWEQLPNELAEIIKAAGPHYHIYASSPATFQALRHEIAPWTVEEGVRIPRFHALNVLQGPQGRIAPFLAQMLLPPSQRKEDATV